MKKVIEYLIAGATALAALASCCKEEEFATDPADFVSTLNGTLSEYLLSTGNTYPATALPWGMNFWTPVTGTMGDGWAYRYDAHEIRGFKQTHQPSPWINDYGQFVIMPVRNTATVSQEQRASWFSHKSETAKPYYYQVYLADHDINAEMTPTERGAILRFTYPEAENSGIIIDAFDGGSKIEWIPEKNAIVGYSTKNSGGVPENFRNYFVISFDKPVTDVIFYAGSNEGRQVSMLAAKLVKNNAAMPQSYEGPHALAALSFDTVRGEQVNVRAASSFISQEQAWLNLGEVADKSFEEVKNDARGRWNDVLGRIRVGGGSEEQYKTFYSCLYRSTLFPRKFHEIDAEGNTVHYSPYNGEICSGYMYTDTGFWDTFRALFPLLNLVYPDVNREIQSALANIARENEFLPEWSSPGHRGCMVGNNSASVVADAIVKGITPEEDWQLLYDCIMHGCENVHPTVNTSGRLGHEYYNSIGYVPYNVGINENVARTLEYAYDDWCIMQIARKLGRSEEEIATLAKRSENWKNVFDQESRLMRGRNLDGSFQEPFSSYKWGDAFTEGNTWHYTWSVFHDVEGLKEAMGGSESFEQMLDSVFVVPPIYDDSYYGQRIHEITEMQVANMGNYAHGNQPAQHMIYLYDWTENPWKCQQHIREVMDRLYSYKPDGYCGDEDNGQTSAWYIFSALGFYPVCPASNNYAIGSPYFRNMEIRPAGGRPIRISVRNADGSEGAPQTFVKELKVNGRTRSELSLDYNELKSGASISFVMSDKH